MIFELVNDCIEAKQSVESKKQRSRNLPGIYTNFQTIASKIRCQEKWRMSDY